MAGQAESSLAARDLLAIWEIGSGKHDVDKALIVLSHLFPEHSWSELACMPVGQRDALLLRVRAKLFGQRIPIGVNCPRCGEKLEFDTSVDAMLAAALPNTAPECILIEAAGYTMTLRPLNSRDLTRLGPDQDLAAARRVLLREVLLAASCEGADVDADQIPDAAVEAAAAALAAADPLADLEFAIACPECRHGWVMLFDIIPYLWRELSGQAHDLLEEVHDLASAYKWHEADILALPAARRRFYLDRIRR